MVVGLNNGPTPQTRLGPFFSGFENGLNFS